MREVRYEFKYDKLAKGLVSTTICNTIGACVASVACGYCNYFNGIDQDKKVVFCRRSEMKKEFSI